MDLYQKQSLKSHVGKTVSHILSLLCYSQQVTSLSCALMVPLDWFGDPFKTFSVSAQKAPLFAFLFTCNLRIRQPGKGAIDDVFLSLNKNADNNVSV